MTLDRYNEKRNFDRTPEPEGATESPGDRLRFVVQKHQASQLHYDFRLEWDGVLKSWAVPKGPSLNPEDKRLAMMVEDHPLDYGSFEGIIPGGNYGAGTVMVWDRGTYRPAQPGADRAQDERTMQQGLQRGHMAFVLEGQKLRGEFSLIKLRRGAPNAWLLVKKGDEFAGADDIRGQDRSVLSGRGMDEIAQSAEAP